MEAIAILGTLDTEETEIVYIDEFTVSEKTYKPNGWSWIKDKKWKLVVSSNFWMGFIVGLSSEVVYEVIGVKGTTTSAIFVSYLKNSQSTLNSEIVLQNQNMSCVEITPPTIKIKT